MCRMKTKTAMTTTVPVEVILAAGRSPVDMNNRFILAADREAYIARAEARGFPANLCAWIKGIYTALREEGVSSVVGVVRGDCSSTEKLLEVWRHEGIETHAFSYPGHPDPALMQEAITALAARMGVTLEQAESVRQELAPVRALLGELDEMTWKEGRVTGGENHLWLVSASDFNGDPDAFAGELAAFLDRVRSRSRGDDFLRLGYAGVPPIVDDLYQYLEERGARVVYNEVQRQFAMLGGHSCLADQYAAYTYPYDTAGRIRDIQAEVDRRGLAAIIHYAQTFCHRQIESILLRESLTVPVLTIEADRPGPLEARTRTRIDAFLEQLSR